MLRDMLSSKLVIAGLIGCVLLVAGSLLYRWHGERDIRNDEVKTERFLQQLENRQTTNAQQPRQITDRDAEEQAAAPVAADNGAATGSDTPERLPNAKAERGDTAPAPEETISKEDTADIPVSPYGFGPYPELPAGWPADQMWPRISATHELMMRVEIKLAHQGIDVMGSIMENGLVYPTITGIVYVEWAKTARRQYIRNMAGDPDACNRIRAIEEERGVRFTEADIPSDIKVLSFPQEGIDPYEFLDLP